MEDDKIDDKIFENSTKFANSVSHQTGFIYTSFPESQSPNFEGITDFPESYRRLTSKEVIYFVVVTLQSYTTGLLLLAFITTLRGEFSSTVLGKVSSTKTSHFGYS